MKYVSLLIICALLFCSCGKSPQEHISQLDAFYENKQYIEAFEYALSKCSSAPSIKDYLYQKATAGDTLMQFALSSKLNKESQEKALQWYLIAHLGAQLDAVLINSKEPFSYALTTALRYKQLMPLAEALSDDVKKYEHYYTNAIVWHDKHLKPTKPYWLLEKYPDTRVVIQSKWYSNQKRLLGSFKSSESVVEKSIERIENYVQVNLTKSIIADLHTISRTTHILFSFHWIESRLRQFPPPFQYEFALLSYLVGNYYESMKWFFIAQLNMRYDTWRIKDTSARSALTIFNAWVPDIMTYIKKHPGEAYRAGKDALTWVSKNKHSYSPLWIGYYVKSNERMKPELVEKHYWQEIYSTTVEKFKKYLESLKPGVKL